LGARQVRERRGGGTKRGVLDINLFVIVAALDPSPPPHEILNKSALPHGTLSRDSLHGM